MRTAITLLVLFFIYHSADAAPMAEIKIETVKDPIVKEPPKNTLGFEGLGRGLLYSVFYERNLTEKSLLGLAVSYYKSSGLDEDGTFVASPYVSIYTSIEPSRFYFTGGFAAIDPSEVKDDDGYYRYGVPMAGLGWEKRFESGSAFRLTGYGMLLAGPGIAMVLPWVGLSYAKTF